MYAVTHAYPYPVHDRTRLFIGQFEIEKRPTLGPFWGPAETKQHEIRPYAPKPYKHRIELVNVLCVSPMCSADLCLLPTFETASESPQIALP
jgi:hypothetical protein